MKTDWIARLDCDKPVQIKVLEKAFSDIPEGASMLIVTPKMVDDVVRSVPVGCWVTQKTIRGTLAKKYNAEYACPVTTGIALRVVAEAAYIKLSDGTDESEITPFWRAINPDDKLAGKLACGRSFIEKKRQNEIA